MSFQSCLLCDVIPPMAGDALLVLNSALDPVVPLVSRQLHTGKITLAEDNIAALQEVHLALGRERRDFLSRIEHVSFHDYLLHQPANTHDIAVMNLLYQPANAWSLYGLRLAFMALKPGGRLYVAGAKERGILTIAKRMGDLFGNVETLVISKGQRVVCAYKSAVVDTQTLLSEGAHAGKIDGEIDLDLSKHIFAGNKLDEGTRLLLDVLSVRATDIALDLGCGAGFIGLHIARLAEKGYVTMVDASLAAVAVAQRAIEQSELHNIRVLPSNSTQAVSTEHFSLVVTNPPFHQGGIQTARIAERFIQDAANILQADGRFYLVANRFLKYETTLTSCFKQVQEVGGDVRYKVLFASKRRKP
jgi:16S rRNA (guanine1207-N2)-methyltransferase